MIIILKSLNFKTSWFILVLNDANVNARVAGLELLGYLHQDVLKMQLGTSDCNSLLWICLTNRVHEHVRHACACNRLTEKIFSSICLIVSIFWEVVNLLTYTSKCPWSRRETQLRTESSLLYIWRNKRISHLYFSRFCLSHSWRGLCVDIW